MITGDLLKLNDIKFFCFLFWTLLSMEDEEARRFHLKYLNCVLKAKKGLRLEQHEGNYNRILVNKAFCKNASIHINKVNMLSVFYNTLSSC